MSLATSMARFDVRNAATEMSYVSPLRAAGDAAASCTGAGASAGAADDAGVDAGAVGCAAGGGSASFGAGVGAVRAADTGVVVTGA
jgi:hypothetical protein